MLFLPYTAHSFHYTDQSFNDVQGNNRCLMWDANQTLNLILVRHKPGWGSEIEEARDYTLPCDTSFRHLVHCARIMTLLRIPPSAVTLQKPKNGTWPAFVEEWFAVNWTVVLKCVRATNWGRTGRSVVGVRYGRISICVSVCETLRFFSFVTAILFLISFFFELLPLLWSPCIFPGALCSPPFVNSTVVYCSLRIPCCISF